MKENFSITHFILTILLFAAPTGAQQVVPDSNIIIQEIREIDASTLEKYQSDPEYNYDDDPRLSSNPISAWWKNLWQRFDSFMQSATSPLVWKIIQYIFMIGVVLLLVYHLGSSYRSGVFGRNDNADFRGEVKYSAEILSEVNLNDLIGTLEEKKEYRKAVRWLYIKTLKDLADRKLLTWNPKSSNEEIISSLQDVAIKKELQSLTKVYEYIWYGTHEVGSFSNYSEIKNRFDQFIHLEKISL